MLLSQIMSADKIRIQKSRFENDWKGIKISLLLAKN